jgi:tRNA (adenine22-N1)-methyltransferase
MGNTEYKGFDVAARMSQRLLCVAGMLGEGAGDGCSFNRTADVGCDHGYVSIYLVQQGISKGAIAMDVRKGPLAMASGNIAECGLEGAIETRLSDGLSELGEGEADSLVIAGMGGKLMMSILDRNDIAGLGIRYAILQPQSDIELFRGYLREKGYVIENERVVFEDGKYYFPMRVRICRDAASDGLGDALEEAERSFARRVCDRYGEHNILRKDELLRRYLEHGREVAVSILSSLDGASHTDRVLEVKQEIEDIDTVLEYFDAK